MIKIAYDFDLRRPGCVILQAAMGGSTEAANRFPSETWLVAPTKGLKLYPVTPKQLDKLVEMSENKSA